MTDAFAPTGQLPTADMVSVLGGTIIRAPQLLGSETALALKGSQPDVSVSGSQYSPTLKGNTT